MERAYAVLEIKSFDAERRRFSGVATSVSVDRMGDIVESKGAEFRLPIPLLWQHDAKDPIGWVTRAKVGKDAIEVEGEIADVSEPGPLRDRLTLAWQYIKNKLVRGLSIGFNPKESARMEGSGGYRFTKWEWLELSAVTVPANQDATVTAIKQLDSIARKAASGPDGVASMPGVSGASNPKGTKTMKTIHEQLSELQEMRSTKAARMKELGESADGGKFAAEARAEFDGLAAEVEDLDDQIRMKRVETMSAVSARPIAEQRRAPAVVGKTDKAAAFEGQGFVRKLIAQTIGQLDQRHPAAVAQERWGNDSPQLVQVLTKANEVAGGGATSGSWGAELVQADSRYTGDFIEFLYSQTVFDRLPLREVPEDVVIKGQDGAATGYWIGEGAAIKVSKADFSTVSLSPLKVAGLCVVTEDLLRRSSPAAERLVRDALVEASAQIIDTTFLSASAASSGVSPAGLLNGLAAGTSAGPLAENVRADVASLMSGFITAKNTSGLTWVMTRTLALQLSMLTNALGQAEFPTISINGGTFMGLPVVVGDNVGTGDLILMKPSDIWKIGDLGIRVSLSRDATIAQNSAPAGVTLTPTGESQAWNNMFQTESVAFKVVRPMNFQKRRTGVVAFIGDADYTGIASV